LIRDAAGGLFGGRLDAKYDYRKGLRPPGNLPRGRLGEADGNSAIDDERVK